MLLKGPLIRLISARLARLVLVNTHELCHDLSIYYIIATNVALLGAYPDWNDPSPVAMGVFLLNLILQFNIWGSNPVQARTNSVKGMKYWLQTGS